MAAADELRVKLLAEDRLTQELKDAEKSVRALKKELTAAAKEADVTGDTSKYDQLKKSFDEQSKAAGKLRGELAKTKREVKSAGDQTVKSAGVMKTAWSKLQKVTSSPLFTAVSLGAVTLFAKAAITSFSEVEDSTDALTATFGESGEALVKWANDSAIAFNLSKREALSATQSFAIFAKAAGLTGQELETFSIALTERAAEAASYFGGTTADAIQAFGSALRGEFNPIEKYGVLLNDATMRIKAMEMGIVSSTKQALTPQQKVLVGYAAILEQTSDAQGDVARTSESMANQIKQGQAQMENLKSTVGETLAVALLPILKTLGGLLSTFNGLPGPIKSVIIGITAFGVALLIIGPRIAAMVTGMRAAGVEATVLKGKMAAAGSFIAGPWGIAIAAATVALGTLSAAHADVAAKAETLVDTLDETTRAATEMTRLKLGEEFLKNFTAEDLEKTPFSLAQITTAVIEGGEAYADLKAQIEEYSSAQLLASKGTDIFWLGALANSVDAMERDYKATRVLSDSKEEAARAVKDAADQSKRMAYTSGTVLAAMRKVNPVLGEYRDKALSASGAASALEVANQRAAGQLERLQGALSGVGQEIARQQALRAYEDAMKEFIAKPTQEAAESVVTAMTTAAESIDNPREQAKFLAKEIGNVESALQSAGLVLPPRVLESVRKLEGAAILAKKQIDAATKARILQITLRFSDSRTTFDGERRATGGWIGGQTGGPTSDTVPALLSRGEYVLRGGAAAALRQAIGDAGLWSLNHADRSMPSFLDSPVPSIAPGGGSEPALVGAGGPVINIGEIKADSGVDVQSEVLWAMRRAERIRRERS